MVSAADGGSAVDGGANVNIVPLLRTLAKGASVTLGGIFSITMISSTTVALFTPHRKNQIGSQSSSSPSSMSKKNASSCDVCRSKGFYMCKLCQGNAAIEWSPLYDPVFINPCLCPTCDGHRIQRCLNCLGSGFIQQAKAAGDGGANVNIIPLLRTSAVRSPPPTTFNRNPFASPVAGPVVTGCISVIINMNLTDAPMDPRDSTANSAFKFGSTYVVEPKGKHQATIVWLHGLGDDGSSWSQVLETLSLPNGLMSLASLKTQVKMYKEWMLQPHMFLACFPLNLQTEDLVWGAAPAIYSAICFSCENFGNGAGCLIHLDAVVGLSGWLPCARALSNKAKGRASLPILLCHGRVDDVVRFRFGEKSVEKLSSAGFENLTFKAFKSLGHYINLEEMAEVSSWLNSSEGAEKRSIIVVKQKSVPWVKWGLGRGRIIL
ncbi:hypothetical protein E3N88_40871 [Mikania micrantha]|uniref:Phospholipase/carboxylesterase/thioesterase domain-containing protein n=1 Tax=Mikania micrantha TaxID=192012 RepID=A0A5N6LNZ3_9ASTR|nr:hypothetical protein E3N88_40871 [Mikania micrantha]